MKVRLDIGKARYEEILRELTDLGIGIDDEADLVLSEAGDYPAFLSGRTEVGTCHVAVTDVLFIESLGHDVFLHVLEDGSEVVYKSRVRLRDYERMLDPEKFLRVSNSAIVARDKVRHIRSALSRKFTLTLEGGSRVDVTRSYYDVFRSEFGI